MEAACRLLQGLVSCHRLDKLPCYTYLLSCSHKSTTAGGKSDESSCVILVIYLKPVAVVGGSSDTLALTKASVLGYASPPHLIVGMDIETG
eukprot:COSAG02_NODE_1650_length_11487_cov_13.602895_12_plen_91_part_00